MKYIWMMLFAMMMTACTTTDFDAVGPDSLVVTESPDRGGNTGSGM